MPLRVLHRSYLASQAVLSLREAILGGEWHDRLPSERTLSTLLKVSRMTIRKALRELEGERLIERKPGNDARRILTSTPVPSAAPAVIVSIVRRSDGLDGALVDNWQNHLQLRLAQMGVPCEVLFFSDRQMRSPRSNPQNWMTTSHRRLWLLVETSRRMQQWFAQNDPDHTLVMGSSYRETGLPSIDRDYRAVGRHAAGVLLGRNHRSIAFFRLKQAVAGDQETEDGFRAVLDACADARLYLANHDGSKEDIHRQLTRALAIRPRITAMFLYKTTVALTVLTRLLQLGIRIPQDLSVMARDESPYFAALPFNLAQYRIRESQIADCAVAQIERFLASRSAALTSVRVQPQFDKGNTILARTGDFEG